MKKYEKWYLTIIILLLVNAIPVRTKECMNLVVSQNQIKQESTGLEIQDPEKKDQSSAEEAVIAKGIIAIDPGHQGSWVDMSDLEPNAPGSSEMKAKASAGTSGRYSGTPEYELNLDISLMLADELQHRGYETVLTREDNDTAISNAERAELANDAGADISIRIHANGSEDSTVSGALTLTGSPDNEYIGHLYEKSSELADDILTCYCETTGFDNDGNQQADNMTGLNWSKIPVVILEMGFMTNESDDTKMNDPEFRKLMVQGIADGIDKFYSDNPISDSGTASASEDTEISRITF